MKIVLPFTTTVPVNSLVHLAYPLGIIYGNCTKRKANMYLIKNHLQMVWYHDCKETGTGYEFCFCIPFFPYRKCFKRHTLDLNPKLNNVIDIIINHINKKCYVYLVADEFYLSGTKNYNKNHVFHDLLIYGYDEQERMFYTAGYNEKKEYSVNTCRFEDIVFEKTAFLQCVKLKNNFYMSISKREIRKKINNYLNPYMFTHKEIKKSKVEMPDFGIKAVELPYE